MRDDIGQVAVSRAMFAPTPEQAEAVASFRRYAEKRLRPLGDKYEKLGAPPPREEVQQLFRELEDFGILSSLIAEEDGASGIGAVGLALFIEEIARNWLGFAFTTTIQAVVATLLAAYAIRGSKSAPKQ